MVALQTKVGNYEREIQQWKKALKRADDYIEELNSEIEKYKNRDISAAASIERNGGNDGCVQKPTFNVPDSCNVPLSTAGERFTLKSKEGFSGLSASETLQKLLPTSSDSIITESPITSTQWNRPRNGRAGEDIRVNSLADIQELPSARKTSTDSSMSNKSTSRASPLPSNSEGASELLADPMRFPACAKLIELTTARHKQPAPSPERGALDRSPSTTRGSYPTNDPSDLSYSISSMQSVAHVRTNSASPVNPSRLHKRFADEDERSLKGTIDGDDITVVIPSSDQAPSWVHSDYPRPSGSSETLPCTSSQSEGFIPERMNGDGMCVVEPQVEYGYYPHSSLSVSHTAAKKIKIENMYE